MLARHVSGAEHQTLALARYLGLERRVTLLANDELAGLLAGDPFLRRYSAGLAVQRLGPAFPEQPARSLRGALSRGRLYLRLQQALGRALRALRPDVVHLVLAPTFFAYAPHFRRLPYPVVITLAGEMRYVRHFYGAGKRLAVRHAAARADALVVCSADELVNLAAVAPRAVSRATLIDNFTDVARFAPAAQKEPLVAFAARLHPEKGALLFVEAAARVRATHPAARFALMGRGEEDARRRRPAERPRTAGRRAAGLRHRPGAPLRPGERLRLLPAPRESGQLQPARGDGLRRRRGGDGRGADLADRRRAGRAPRRALARGPGRGHRRHAGRSAGDGRPGSGRPRARARRLRPGAVRGPPALRLRAGGAAPGGRHQPPWGGAPSSTSGGEVRPGPPAAKPSSGRPGACGGPRRRSAVPGERGEQERGARREHDQAEGQHHHHRQRQAGGRDEAVRLGRAARCSAG